VNALVHHQFNAPVFTMGDIERVALAIAKGGLFGSTDPNAVLTLCFLAQAEGQHPAVVFRDYHIIKGKPAKKADAMLRDFVQAGGKVEWHALDDTVADATFSHPSGGTLRIDWTMDRARQAQLTTDMWRKYPRQMLRSRVISEGVRSVYPGATSGLYEVGEVQDMVEDRAPPQRPAPTVEAIEHHPAEAEAEEAITEEQRQILMDLAVSVGVSSPELCTKCKVSALPELPASKFAAVKAWLEGKLTKEVKAIEREVREAIADDILDDHVPY